MIPNAKPVSKKTKQKSPVKPHPAAVVRPLGPISTLETAVPTLVTPVAAIKVPNSLSPGSAHLPSAVLATPGTPGKTGFGRLYAQAGGLAGIATTVATVLGGSKDKPTATAADDKTGAGADDQNTDTDKPFTVLGLPPFALAAVLVLLVVGVLVLVHLSKKGGGA